MTSLLVASAWAQPDLRQMAGTPLPSSDLPNGAVSVRVVRGAISNNVSDQRVELVGGPQPLAAATDGSGRAQFDDVPRDATLRAVAVVDGERLESQPFQRPLRGGVRLLLAAGLGDVGSASGGATGAAQPGDVALGNDSRFIVELAEGSVEVFGALEIVNVQKVPVQPSAPIVFEVPPDAQSATVLEGSAKQALVEGQRVLVTGPFAPGSTPVQFAYRLPYSNGRLTIEQRVPIPLSQLNVAVRRAGDMRADVRGAAQQRETAFEGRTYLVAGGPGLARGETVRIDLEGLPHHPRWPLYLAIGLAAAILLSATLVLMKPVREDVADTGALEAQRRTLLEALVAVEHQQATGALEMSAYAAKRAALVEALEPIYEQIDRLHRNTPAARGAGAGADLRPKAASPDPVARA
ncbi:MAG: hypothetical protein GEU99_09200 [Luteitalea sp.]|nr:hypothetical protein [Luteitalea sp.]